MPTKIDRLAADLAVGGWTTVKVNRLVAAVEEDGVGSAKECESLKEILARDGYVEKRPTGARLDNFLGHSRSRLTQYTEFLTRVNEARSRRRGGAAGSAPQGLIVPGRRDVDQARYREHVEMLAGEKPVAITENDGTTREVRIRDRFVASQGNQLTDVLAWLRGYYTALGLEPVFEPVAYRGKTFYNLVVTIPGASDEAVLLADHYDVADKELGRTANRKQLTVDHCLKPREIQALSDTIPVGAAVPGADDNGSATAALMEMGRLLSEARRDGVRLGKTIKLAHLVGEELPANCLGGRAMVRDAVQKGEKIAGVVVLDMIGVDRAGRRKMQISAGRHSESVAMAARVKDAVDRLDLDLKPIFRPFGARKSFLHQTDALEFSRAGFPVILINEHLNDDHDLYRVGYHDEFDTTRLMTFEFATNVTRAALEVVYELAEPER